MKFTVEYLEVFLLVMVRISAMVYIMPFFGDRSIPVKVKIAISFFLAVLVGNTAVSYTHLDVYKRQVHYTVRQTELLFRDGWHRQTHREIRVL